MRPNPRDLPPAQKSTAVSFSFEPRPETLAREIRPPAFARMPLATENLEWQERLPDGRPIVIRPVRPGDAASLRAGFKRLAERDVRMRFFRSLSDLTPAMTDYLTRIDYDRHMALVAEAPETPYGQGGGGVARYIAEPDYRRAEFAIIVVTGVQRHGIGSLLIDRLIACAAARGIDEVWGDVLAENTAMLAFAKKHGFQIVPSPEGPGLLRVSQHLHGLGRGALLHPRA